MAQLTIGNFVFTFSHLQTMRFHVTPEMDPSGTDVESKRVDLEVMGLVQGSALASPAGASMPSTIVNIRDALMQPRQYVKFQIGNQVVFQSPVVPAAKITAPSQPADVKVGPIIDDARYSQFMGDKTALLYVRLHSWVSYSSCFCTGLRWSIEASTNDMGMTTRLVRGRASFRKDALLLNQFKASDGSITTSMPDDWRSLLVPPCPREMRRTGMRVVQDAAGAEVEFHAQDQEINAGTGPNSMVLRIECLPSAGISTTVKDLKASVESSWEKVKSVVKGGMMAMPSALWSAVPTAKAAGVCRVWGRKGADLKSLVRVAVAVIADRYRPALAGYATCPSFWVTTNSDTDNTPWVEVRAEFIGFNHAFLNAILKGDPTELLNLSSDITYPPPDAGGAATLLSSTKLSAAQLQSSNNTRGSWTGRLVAQQLLASSNPPPAPPGNQNAVDAVGPLT